VRCIEILTGSRVCRIRSRQRRRKNGFHSEFEAMKFSRSALAVALPALLLAVAVAAGKAPNAAVACSHGTVSRLYLGQSTPAGSVSDMQWRAFVADAVTPRFPAGFTEHTAHGHWRDDRGLAQEEQTRIVEVAHDDSPLAHERIRAIAADYRTHFEQQSVLVTQSPTMQCLEGRS
jgi:hypothetical protein